MRVLILGCGSIGTRHLRNLLELGGQQVVAFDPRPDRVQAIAQTFDGVDVCTDPAEAWSATPDAAIVASPSSCHLEQALEGAARGIPLLVEKPLAHRIDGDLTRLLETTRIKELVTMVGCNMRFHPGPALVKRLIQEGRIGRVLFARVFGGSYLPDLHPEEDHRARYSGRRSLGGGCVLDGIHEIDLARWYVGEVRTVGALLGQVGELGIDVEDLASIVMRHEGGQQSEVHLDYVQRLRIRGCVVVGTEGTLQWEWSDPVVRRYSASDGSHRELPLPPDWDLNQMYMDEMRHFLECVKAGGTTCNPFSDAARVTAVALAARVSDESRAFVDIDDIFPA